MSMMRAAGKKESNGHKHHKHKHHEHEHSSTPSAEKERDVAPSVASSTGEVTVWYFVVNNVPINLAFRKKDLSVWVNSIEVETEEEQLRLTGVNVKFEIFGKVAVITYMSSDKPVNDTVELRYAGNLINPKPIK